MCFCVDPISNKSAVEDTLKASTTAQTALDTISFKENRLLHSLLSRHVN